MERDFKGVWIPNDLWLNKKLTLIEKVFLVEIKLLDGESGCYASNSHFSEFFGLSKNRCSGIIRGLRNKGYIKITYFYEKGKKSLERRVVRLNEGFVIEKLTKEIESSMEARQLEWEKENIILKPKVKSLESTVSKEIVAYLNYKCSVNYKFGTKKTVTLINARIKEGYGVESFKKVIDKKCKEWMDSPMSKYLRPETLFGTKFESYVNEPETNNKINKIGGEYYDRKCGNLKNNRENKGNKEVREHSKWSRGSNTSNRRLTEEEREWAARELI